MLKHLERETVIQYQLADTLERRVQNYLAYIICINICFVGIFTNISEYHKF